ncbi:MULTISPECIES: hypothetical protein [Acinetobacter]|jgi:hypothetical protein|uniref:hypothetical protein n=1 Tax=Acinetobacter TaxID=469 RepID=UPI00145F599D|nr:MULTISPECIES: hypothetical protein [Acinetobacter]MBC9228638.1 hypothetical protein [Acinetobacter baumannii]MDF2416656.1 hypothetical protein [Acinetobacter beijerinckii]USA54767.1 hypothetical protein NDN13_06160 [Acinetobacter sp. C32I]WEI17732.1 hypothetical protein PY247_15210 [Acinetobacter proteolyticus]
MSKLGCVCGHVIVDQTDQIPYKASFITDVDLFDFYEAVDNTINTSLNHKETFSEQIIDRFIRYSADMYECTQCGRLWIGIGNNQFKAFLPESGKYQAILNIQHDRFK